VSRGQRTNRRSVIVVGSGIAGLTTAIHASERHDVLLVTAGPLDAANTAHAQGGIAGVLDADPGTAARRGATAGARDTVAAHIADTIRAGAGLCVEDAVRVLCSEAPDRLRDLIALGVPFDRVGGDVSRALEAAHSAARVLHAGGDATGAAIERVLVDAARARVSEIREHTRVVDLVVRGGVVVGVSLDGPAGASTVHADAVVLATGGFAGLYAHSSNPPFATGSGIAVAARAGALLADLEFVQFHPSVLAAPGSFLVSEAVRGEGAVLRNERGERFMLPLHPDAELAPRDVVARAIASAMREQGGRPVVLDATGIDGARLDARFPGIARRVREAGYDWTVEPVPVTPAAHYTMGGIATDLDGRTSVPGLFAVGEVARTGVHGANRLASNSLMEGAVFGARVAQALSGLEREPLGVRGHDVSPVAIPVGDDSPSTGALSSGAPSSGAPSSGAPSSGAPSSGAPSSGFPTSGRSIALGDLLWDEVGLVRSEAGLVRARTGVETLVARGGDRDALTVATLVTYAALHRRESRGAHARSDHPATDPALARPLFLRGEARAPSDAAPTARTMGAAPRGAVPIGAATETRESIAC
jgi:L-aspartate oxidase